jgi:transposase
MNDFDKDVLCRTVYEFYDKGEYPTASKLRKIMEEKIGFSESQSSILRLLRKMGSRYRRCNDRRKFLTERRDTVATRMEFLRTMHNIRSSGDTRPIFYLDKMWVNQNHSLKYIWQDFNRSGGLKVPVGKGSRIIVCHAGSNKTGFVEDSKLIFQSKDKQVNSDYHSEMNTELFTNWFINNLINYLEEGSIIAMDNASYHSAILNKAPLTNSRKSEIVDWLKKKNITVGPTKTRAELLQCVQLLKTRKIYELDHIANERGHQVVQLPPYHCQYNPIELTWAQVKREVADRNKTFKLADVERLMSDAIDRVTVEDWQKCVRHAERLQHDYFVKECSRDSIIEPIVINLRDSDTDNEEEPE